jgi:hypothetical protein
MSIGFVETIRRGWKLEICGGELDEAFGADGLEAQWTDDGGEVCFVCFQMALSKV